MEANDTVVKYQSSHKIIIDSKEWHHKEGYNLGAQAQAEISFKAGIREVVEWIGCMDAEGMKEGNLTLVINFMAWQAKLKEWGVE